MRGKEIGATEHPDLLALPHIVDKLLRFMVGEWQPNDSQWKQLVGHVKECSYCRTALIMLLFAEQKSERVDGYFGLAGYDLLMQFVTIHQEIEVLDYESIGGYAEAIIAEGKERADECFPVLAIHIQRCVSCKSALEDTLAFLLGSGETSWNCDS